jgi:hypothetical protein
MPAEIDIVVSSPDSTEARLIVETKLVLRDRSAAVNRLRTAMLQMSCPVGLLLTPEKMWVYADTFESARPDSIESVGEFKIGHLLGFTPTESSPNGARLFESRVQKWLEDLPRTATQDRVADKRLWQVLNRYVLPAIETGEVRAAAPRY